MKSKVTKVVLAVLAFAALAVGGATIAGAVGGGDKEDEGPDQSISGSDLSKASKAALAETGGGKVTDTEVGDEESYYEVEVTLDDGKQVDVQLDKGFDVVGQSADEEKANDE